MKKFLPKTKNNTSGFTLIELMVVVAIIAILSAIGMVVFTQAQRNSRDAKRRADITAISAALELDFATNNRTLYQVPTAAMFSDGIPTAPTGTGYTLPTAAAATYCICAVLENTTAGNFAAACAAGATNFCKRNQQ